MVYEAGLVGAAEVRFVDRKRKIDEQVEKILLLPAPANSAHIDWDEAGQTSVQLNELRNAPEVVGPEQGFSLPGTTIVCGDSHTASHGGLGALAFGIGSSEVEHVLATQTLLLKRSKPMEVRVEGMLPDGVSAKDLILHIIGVIGTAGGTGHVIEYRGKVFELPRRAEDT